MGAWCRNVADWCRNVADWARNVADFCRKQRSVHVIPVYLPLEGLAPLERVPFFGGDKLWQKQLD